VRNRIIKGGEAKPAVFQTFSVSTEQKSTPDIRRVVDARVTLSVRLGSTNMKVRDILALKKGSVIGLDREAGSFVNIYANGKYIAKGEVIVLEDRYVIRIAEIANADVLHPNKKIGRRRN